jgi:hypothetical protein
MNLLQPGALQSGVLQSSLALAASATPVALDGFHDEFIYRIEGASARLTSPDTYDLRAGFYRLLGLEQKSDAGLPISKVIRLLSPPYEDALTKMEPLRRFNEALEAVKEQGLTAARLGLTNFLIDKDVLDLMPDSYEFFCRCCIEFAYLEAIEQDGLDAINEMLSENLEAALQKVEAGCYESETVKQCLHAMNDILVRVINLYPNLAMGVEVVFNTGPSLNESGITEFLDGNQIIVPVPAIAAFDHFPKRSIHFGREQSSDMPNLYINAVIQHILHRENPYIAKNHCVELPDVKSVRLVRADSYTPIIDWGSPLSYYLKYRGFYPLGDSSGMWTVTDGMGRNLFLSGRLDDKQWTLKFGYLFDPSNTSLYRFSNLNYPLRIKRDQDVISYLYELYLNRDPMVKSAVTVFEGRQKIITELARQPYIHSLRFL